VFLVPISVSGNNVYVTWSSNKTGNDEIMFKVSADSGKTFGERMNLSNSPNSESQDVEIAASGNNVYVTWWERNQTMNEPMIRISNDNGKTFGEKIMLSAK
jgi:peroxiredoxin